MSTPAATRAEERRQRILAKRSARLAVVTGDRVLGASYDAHVSAPTTAPRPPPEKKAEVETSTLAASETSEVTPISARQNDKPKDETQQQAVDDVHVAPPVLTDSSRSSRPFNENLYRMASVIGTAIITWRLWAFGENAPTSVSNASWTAFVGSHVKRWSAFEIFALLQLCMIIPTVVRRVTAILREATTQRTTILPSAADILLGGVEAATAFRRIYRDLTLYLFTLFVLLYLSEGIL